MAQVVVFEVDRQLYGIEITNVASIEKQHAVTRLPGTADFVRGLMNLRGVIVPVIDGRRFLGKEEFTDDIPSRTLILERGAVRVGFMVDSTKNVIDIENSLVQPVPDEFVRDDQIKLSGVVYVDSHAIGLMEVEPILDSRGAVV